MAPKEPMSLENLPGYLQSQQDGNLAGGAPVIGMGQIVVPQKKSILPRFLFAAVVFMGLGMGGLVTYDVMATKQLTVVVDMKQGADPQTISQIVSDSGGEVISVTQKDDSTFEVEVETRKSKSSFLEWLLKNRSIKKAELEE